MAEPTLPRPLLAGVFKSFAEDFRAYPAARVAAIKSACGKAGFDPFRGRTDGSTAYYCGMAAAGWLSDGAGLLPTLRVSMLHTANVAAALSNGLLRIVNRGRYPGPRDGRELYDCAAGGLPTAAFGGPWRLPAPGDIAIMFRGRVPEFGDHIALVADVISGPDGVRVLTLEGNGHVTCSDRRVRSSAIGLRVSKLGPDGVWRWGCFAPDEYRG